MHTACSLQVLHYIRNVDFSTRQGERVFFDNNGDSPPTYELINLQRVTSGIMHVATIGFYDASLASEHQFTMKGLHPVWGGSSDTVHFNLALLSYLWFVGQYAIS